MSQGPDWTQPPHAYIVPGGWYISTGNWQNDALRILQDNGIDGWPLRAEFEMKLSDGSMTMTIVYQPMREERLLTMLPAWTSS